jgi:virginiamycin B lyase
MPSAFGADISEIPLGDRGSGPYHITAGPDGALWLTLIHSGQVARMTQLGRITPDGHLTEYPLPNRSARPHAIIADPAGGGCWFTEWAANCIGRITPAGQVEEYDLPTPSSEPHGLAMGTDGAIYAALEIGSIARLMVTP